MTLAPPAKTRLCLLSLELKKGSGLLYDLGVDRS